MILYATINSEKATKGQGGNKYLTIRLMGEGQKKNEAVVLADIEMLFKETKEGRTYYVKVFHAKADEADYIITLPVPNTPKGKKQKGKEICLHCRTHCKSVGGAEYCNPF